MTSAQAFIFITSPGSVTPYHIDPEHNFLLQVHGSKTVRMLDGSDRDVLSDRELEGFYADQGRNLEFDESNQESGWKFLLEPGMGLHFPSHVSALGAERPGRFRIVQHYVPDARSRPPTGVVSHERPAARSRSEPECTWSQ